MQFLFKIQIEVTLHQVFVSLIEHLIYYIKDTGYCFF